MPATANGSLHVNGTPCSGPLGATLSAATASSRASSSRGNTSALISGSRSAIRAACASNSSSAETSRSRTARAIHVAGCFDQCRHVATLARSRAHVTRRGADDPRARALPRRAPALARAARGGGAHAARRRADELDGAWAGAVPALRRRRRRARASPTSTATSYVDFCLGDTGAMTGHSPGRDGRARSRAQARARHHARCCRPRTPIWVGEELARRFGLPLLAVRADRHRRQPLRAPPRPPRSPAGRRSSSSTGATTAPSTRRSPTLDDDGGVGRARRQHRAAGRRSARPRASSSSTTSTRSSTRSRPATSPACSPSRR